MEIVRIGNNKIILKQTGSFILDKFTFYSVFILEGFQCINEKCNKVLNANEFVFKYQKLSNKYILRCDVTKLLIKVLKFQTKLKIAYSTFLFYFINILNLY